MSGFKRDGRDRPLIIPLIEGDLLGRPDLTAKPIPYGRISKFAGLTDDSYNLTVWQQRTTARGLADRPDLLEKVRAVNATYNDPLDHPQAKAQMKAIVRDAHIAGGGDWASRRGTHLHKLTEYVDAGEPLPDRTFGDGGVAMETTVRDVAVMMPAYKAALDAAGIGVIVIELNVVNDDLRVAGTLDRLFRLPDGRVVVADYKTGAHDPNYPGKPTAQVRTYSRAKRYDHATGVRTPLHPDLDPDTGLLIHQPDKGDGTCTIYELNLAAADPILEAGRHVIAARAIPKKSLIRPFA